MLTQTNIPISGLLDGYEAALTKMGYSLTTKLLFIKRADLIIRRHLNRDSEYLLPNVIIEYIQEIDERYFNGDMKRRYHERVRREIERFVNYASSGNSSMQPSPLRGARQKLLPEFEQISEEFLSGKCHPNTRCDMRWTAYKYFSWLEGQGHKNLNGVGAVHLQKFLLYCSEQYAPSSIHNIRLYLKKLYAFLYATGQAEADYCELLSFTVNREKKVLPSLPKSDIAKLLDAIDRSSVKGKRDYAVMMFGTVLGLRACDVAASKLTDID